MLTVIDWFVNGFVYFKNNLILTEKVYDYYLKGHLENTRVRFTESITIPGQAEALQVDNYYPFGMRFNQAPILQVEENNYLYNGKELQKNYGLDLYDYGARIYDPALGRFTTIDPWAERYNFQSPYLYAYNNPVRYTDFLGLGAEDEVDDEDEENNNDADNDNDDNDDSDDDGDDGENPLDTKPENLIKDETQAADNTNVVVDDKNRKKAELVVLNTGDIAIVIDGVTSILYTAQQMTKIVPNWLGVVSRASAQLGNVGDVINIGYQAYLISEGEISPARGYYRIGFSGGSIVAATIVGAKVGSWPGALAGLAVGLLGASGEAGYDCYQLIKRDVTRDLNNHLSVPGGWESGFTGVPPEYFE